LSSLRPQTPTSAFYKLLDQIVTNERNTKKSFDDAVTLARGQGFTDTEISMFMQDYLKGKVPARTLYRWTKGLLPLEESSSGSVPPAENNGNNGTDDNDSPPQETPEVQKAREMMPDLEEDEELATKRLQKALEELKTKDDLISEKDEKIKQLSQVVGKDSFKKASDPENMDVEYFPKISLVELMGKIRSKQASGWHFVENRMRYIS